MFHHKGLLRMEGGSFKVIKTIDVSYLDDQIGILEWEISELFLKCKDRLLICSDKVLDRKGKLFSVDLNKLKHDVNALYSVLGSYKQKRGINVLGSGLRYLFGVMDNDDRGHVTKILNSLGKRPNSIHKSMGGMVQVMKNLSAQANSLIQNQALQLENFKIMKREFEEETKFRKRLDVENSYKNLELNINNLFLSIQVQIDKVKNAVLFLKSGVLDPFFVDQDDLLAVLTYKNLNYPVLKENFGTIVDNSKLIAVCNISKKQIHVILTIPTGIGKRFNLYENLVIPKVFGQNSIMLNGVNQFLAVSLDNKEFFEIDHLQCFEVYKMWVCKNTVVYKVGLHNSCITNIFFHNNDTDCVYKKLNSEVEVHNSFGNGLIVFSSIGLPVKVACKRLNATIVLKGAYLLNPPTNCSIKSNNFNYLNTQQVETRLQLNKIPDIVCCSAFFNDYRKVNETNSTIVFKSLKEVQSLDFETVSSDLENWKDNTYVTLQDMVYGWRYWIVVCLISTLMCVIVFIKFRNLCKQELSGSNVVVTFKQVVENEQIEAPKIEDRGVRSVFKKL